MDELRGWLFNALIRLLKSWDEDEEDERKQKIDEERRTRRKRRRRILCVRS